MQECGPQKDHAGQPAARDALDQPVDRVGSLSCWLGAGGQKKRLLPGVRSLRPGNGSISLSTAT